MKKIKAKTVIYFWCKWQN